jgi:hypothetical protein
LGGCPGKNFFPRRSPSYYTSASGASQAAFGAHITNIKRRCRERGLFRHGEDHKREDFQLKASIITESSYFTLSGRKTFFASAKKPDEFDCLWFVVVAVNLGGQSTFRADP